MILFSILIKGMQFLKTIIQFLLRNSIVSRADKLNITWETILTIGIYIK
jgi:hypothetical protein